MEQKLIITELTFQNKQFIVSALFAGDRMIEVSCEENTEPRALGSIYVGRVKDVVKNINAAFIEISPGESCYYSLEDYKNPIFVKKSSKKDLVQGDEVVVQIVKESMKTKPPRVSTNISFSGKYMVLTTGNLRLGISKKIDPLIGTDLKKLLQPLKKDTYGMIIRTNAAHADEPTLIEEFQFLEKQLLSLHENAKYRTCFSCLHKGQAGYIKNIQNVYTESLKEIVTDQPDIYQEIHNFLSRQQTGDLGKLRKYEDASYPLSTLYSLPHKIEEALKEKVWLKSGAYLIIQPTEALTVIDVNTGKSTYKKDPQQLYLRTNIEAAKEIAHQLRLRNISGIIIVDFIDMEQQEAKEELLETLRKETKKDPVPVSVIGITKLNLVEMTRKKIQKSLIEQLKGEKVL